MPTGDEYRAAAVRLRAAADEVAVHLGAQLVSQRAAFVSPGPVRTLIDASLEAALRDLGRAAGSLTELASVCDRRAAICDAYRRAYHEYRSIDPLRRLLTDPPQRPARWAEP